MNSKIIIAIFLIVLPSIKTLAQNSTAAKDTTIIIKIKGFTCSNDLKTVATNIKEIKGVKGCKPGKLGPTSTYKLTYNLAAVNRKDIVAIIENTSGCGDGDEKPYSVKK